MGSDTPLYRRLRLSDLEIPGNLLLAPLAGYTDTAFRAVCLAAGASLAFTEMVSCEALARSASPGRGTATTLDLARRAPGERFLAVQLFTANPDSASRAVDRLRALAPDILDLNCGCSVPKVLRSGSGAALLRDPELLGRVVGAVAASSLAPVTVKLRSGWDAQSVNFGETAAAAVSAGACMVTLHPRTRAQGFTGRADWSQIAELKRRLTVPVLGSGDLFSAADAREMLVQTGCDGVMFARGAIGNPFIFAEARALLEGREPPPPAGARERLEAALRHLDLAVSEQGERLACREMRKHMQAYTRGIPGGARLRRALTTAADKDQFVRAVRAFLDGSLVDTEREESI
jgi:tRNA-dihydrouridine synthase B